MVGSFLVRSGKCGGRERARESGAGELIFKRGAGGGGGGGGNTSVRQKRSITTSLLFIGNGRKEGRRGRRRRDGRRCCDAERSKLMPRDVKKGKWFDWPFRPAVASGQVRNNESRSIYYRLRIARPMDPIVRRQRKKGKRKRTDGWSGQSSPPLSWHLSVACLPLDRQIRETGIPHSGPEP